MEDVGVTPLNTGPLLVVEDCEEDFAVLQMTLRRLLVPNPVYRCCDGDEAIAYLTGQGTYAQPDAAPRPQLILLDLNLPGMDGREVLTAIKANSDLRAIPVIIFTTSDFPRDVRLCYERGANCYAVKPVGMERFEQFIVLLRDFWLCAVQLPEVR